MFTPRHHRRVPQQHVDAAPEAPPTRLGLSETEADAEARAQFVMRDVGVHVVPAPQGAGGVDAADVLHYVHSTEVHACVEAALPAAPQPPVRSTKATPDRP